MSLERIVLRDDSQSPLEILHDAILKELNKDSTSRILDGWKYLR